MFSNYIERLGHKKTQPNKQNNNKHKKNKEKINK